MTETTTKLIESSEGKSEGGSRALPECGDNIDPSIFEQILEMDDDDEGREFSRGIVYSFFDQADATFKKMDEGLKSGDLNQLSSLGHFLKGSSATLGLTKVKDGCEKIQICGARDGKDDQRQGVQRKDDQGEGDRKKDDRRDERLAEIEATLAVVREQYVEVETILKNFYEAPRNE